MRSALTAVSLAIALSLSHWSAAECSAEDPAAAASTLPPETALRMALQQKASVEFVDTPLVDVMSFLADKHNIQILLDRKAFAEAGTSPDAPVTLRVKNLPLRSVLSLILEQVEGTTWTLRMGVCEITTKDKANSQLTTKTYILHDVLGDDLAREYDGGRLANMITAHIAPESWQTAGGQAAINAVGARYPVLVVTQSWQNHEAITDLLAQLRSAHRAEPKPEPKPVEPIPMPMPTEPPPFDPLPPTDKRP